MKSNDKLRKAEQSGKSLYHKIADNDIPRNIVLTLCALLIVICIISVCLSLFTRHNKQIDVPDFLGMELNEAKTLAKHSKLKIEVNDSLYVPEYNGGSVLDQTPAPDSKVKSGRNIFVTVNSFRQKKVTVPYVTGYSLRQAKNIIEVAGLEIDEIIYVDDIATNYVLEERAGSTTVTKDSRTEVDAGSSITLVVGRGGDAHGMVHLPKLIGHSLTDAKGKLWERGLNVGKIKYDEDINLLERKNAKIYVQSPEQAQSATLGSKVDLWLTLDVEKIEKGSASSDTEAKRIIEQRLKAVEDTLHEAEVTATPEQEVFD